MAQHENPDNYEKFLDCLSSVLIECISRPSTTTKAPKKARRRRKPPSGRSTTPPVAVQDEAIHTKDERHLEEEGGRSVPADPDALADFIEYVALESFAALPAELQALDRGSWDDEAALQTRYALPLAAEQTAAFLAPRLDPSVPESLRTYFCDGGPEPDELLARALTAYITAATAPPPLPGHVRGAALAGVSSAPGSAGAGTGTGTGTGAGAGAGACELCGRDWVPLTFHHLVPRRVHDKAVRRGWHPPAALHSGATLCGACHRFVHHFADHETLAREYYTVERLLAQDEVVAFARWAGRLRWKGGGTRGGGRR